MSKILIGSPIRQNPRVLEEFLSGLNEADKDNNEICYFFVDDNSDTNSSDLLKKFADDNDVIIKKGIELFNSEYFYENHNWNTEVLQKITVYKNTIIKYCIEKGFDYLLLIDSDIVIDKRMIPQLVSDNVDIVSNVFWSQWQENGPLTSQCFWIPEIYKQDKDFCVPYTFQELHKIRMDKNESLKEPGLHTVDGLGACTLISRHALESGVSFQAIHNVKIPGEDRPFCIRAGVLGFKLYMDTHYPAYHINRIEYLDRVNEFKRDGWKFDMCCSYEEKPPMKFKHIRKVLVSIGKLIDRIGRKLIRDFSD